MALAVVADERVRHVHAVLGLGGDQAVALVVDELLELWFLPPPRGLTRFASSKKVLSCREGGQIL